MLLLSTQQDQHVAQSSDDHFSFLHKIIILYLNSHLIRSVQKKKKKKKKKFLTIYFNYFILLKK